MVPIYPQGVLKLVPVEKNGALAFINVNNPYLIIDSLDANNNVVADLSATLDLPPSNHRYIDEVYNVLKTHPIEGLFTFLNGNFDQSVLRSGITKVNIDLKFLIIVEYPHKHI